jgi:hypothetical protein
MINLEIGNLNHQPLLGMAVRDPLDQGPKGEYEKTLLLTVPFPCANLPRKQGGYMRLVPPPAPKEGAIQLGDLPEFKALKERMEAAPPEKEVIQPEPNTPRKGFTGRIASGRGRVVSADDSSYAIEANPPLNAREMAYAQKHGFDDESPHQDGSLLIADKRMLRESGGDVNHVAMLVTGKDAGRGR